MYNAHNEYHWQDYISAFSIRVNNQWQVHFMNHHISVLDIQVLVTIVMEESQGPRWTVAHVVEFFYLGK